MAFTKINAAGIGTTETVTVDGLTVINDGSFGGNLSVGGTITYEDVTNVDSVGIITARAGVLVGSGITLSKDGDIFATGVTTSTTFVGALTGNVTGNISGGTVAGSTGTFSGAISGTTGTFTGDVDIADKIIHTGDTNTAIRFPAADTITAETAGTERLRIDSSGRLLVKEGVNASGTYGQYATLQLKGNSTNTNASIMLMANGKNTTANVSGDYLGYIVFGDKQAGEYAFMRGAVDAAPAVGDYPGRIEFHTTADGASGATERLRIDSTGRVRIGCTAQPSPTVSGAQFDAGGKTLRISEGGGTSSTTGSSVQITGGGGSTSVGAAAAMGAVLTLVNCNNTDNNQTSIDFMASTELSTSKVIGKNDSHSSRNGSLIFATSSGAAPAERLRITSVGKVGINETSPDQALHVKGTGGDTVPMRVQSTGATSRIGFEVAGSSNSYNVSCGAADVNIFGVYTNNTERLRITSDGSVGFGLGGTYAPETPIDVFTNWANTRSNVATSNTYDRKLPLNERGDITLTARHSSSKDSAVGYVGPIIDFRSTNTSSEEWTVAQLVGGTDPLGGNGYQGGLSIFTSNGGTNNPSGRRDQGDAPTLSAVFAPFRLTTFTTTSAQGNMAIHVTKNHAANNVQSDMIAFDVGGGGRGKIVSASSGSGNPQFSAYSDRRLKTNFRDYTGGYDRIKAIPVKLYDEVLNDQTKSVFGDYVKTNVIGWIADEVQSIFPEAVVGTKDQVATADDVTAGISTAIGDPIYQSISEGTFLPDAIQTIQKLIEKVETLETKVAVLEG